MISFENEEKARLLAEFSACLDLCGPQPHAVCDDDAVDLYTLLNEMAALKNEVRLEARQSKNTLDELRASVDLLREHNAQLTRELELARERASTAQQQTESALLSKLLDLRDRLQASVDAVANWRPSAWLHCLPGIRFARRLGEGQALTLQRVDECLADYQVSAINVVDQALNPHLMRAISVEARAEQPDGIVLREVRRGFLRHGKLLRTAEVIVNKRTLS